MINSRIYFKMQSFTGENESSRLETVFAAGEDFISASRGPDNKRGRKRKSCTISVFTSEWREAVIHFAGNLSMELLIQEFNNFYPNVRSNKRISVGKSGENSNARTVQKEEKKDGKVADLPPNVLEKILFRLQPADVLSCRSICHGWNALYDSKHFQKMHYLEETCIVVNNHNLDMWAFSVISKRWFLIKVPCDWDTLGMKTLGIKAACGGLFLVARSDLTLFVVNPLTSQYKSLPRISPHTRKHVQFMKSLLVHGTAEMKVDQAETGSYGVFLFGHYQEKDKSYVHLARYDSLTEIWEVEKVRVAGDGLLSRFPGRLRSYSNDNGIVCFTPTAEFFSYLCPRGLHSLPSRPVEVWNMELPAGIEIQNRHGEGDNSVTFPTMGSCDPEQEACIGRLKGNNNVEGVYGRLPIVSHSNLGIWKRDGDELTGQWQLLKPIPVEFMQAMIETSEGTDFVVVGDGTDVIWLMLRGSRYMLQYTISTGVLQLQPGCPGGGYMDANFHWKAVFEDILFYVAVSSMLV